MSEQQSAEATETETEATEQQGSEQTKPTETVDFWKQKAREQEKRAKENAAAAQRLAEIEQEQKSEAEKAADRLRELETERDNAMREALRFKVASKYGIGDEDAALFLTASDEETLTKQAERLAARTEASSSARPPKPDANQGRPASSGPTSTADSFAEFFRANLSER